MELALLSKNFLEKLIDVSFEPGLSRDGDFLRIFEITRHYYYY